MATALAIGVGVAATAFLVSSPLTIREGATYLTLMDTGPRRSDCVPQISRRSGGRFSAGKGVLQRGLRAQDEPAGSCADIATEVWYPS